MKTNNIPPYDTLHFINVNKNHLLQIIVDSYPWKRNKCQTIIKRLLTEKRPRFYSANKKERNTLAKALELSSFNYTVNIPRSALMKLITGTKYEILTYLAFVLRYIPRKGIKIRWSNITDAFDLCLSQTIATIGKLTRINLLQKQRTTYLLVCELLPEHQNAPLEPAKNQAGKAVDILSRDSHALVESLLCRLTDKALAGPLPDFEPFQLPQICVNSN